jgi:alkanesulfonate monooxygenase SsuD/methylene tetrahydromethanopterin reductase-like flavin-dependent oxidoreductase (luciferase family)
MSRLNDTSIDGLKNLSEVLDGVGYYSVLMVYHSTQPDHWIKAAHILNKNHKIKYMPAIRTYAMTPEYCAMMCRAFNEIQPNRLMLNIVTGDLKKEEKSINDLIYINDLMDTPEKRLKYTSEWIKKFKSFKIDGGFPEIVMSGHSDITNNLAKEYADYHLSWIGQQTKFISNKNIISVPIVIRDTYEEAKQYVIQSEFNENVTIFGTEDQVINKLNKIILDNPKITDFMLQGDAGDIENWYRIHNMSKKIIYLNEEAGENEIIN